MSTDPTEKVTIEVLSERNTIKEGDNITLKCSGNGNPPPQEFLFYIQVSMDYLQRPFCPCKLLHEYQEPSHFHTNRLIFVHEFKRTNICAFLDIMFVG